MSVGFGKLRLEKLNMDSCESLESLPDSKLLLITPTPDMCDQFPYLEIGLTVPLFAARRLRRADQPAEARHVQLREDPKPPCK